MNWLENAPDRETTLQVVATLWVLWCNKNNVLFENKHFTLEESLNQIQGSLRELTYFQSKEEHRFALEIKEKTSIKMVGVHDNQGPLLVKVTFENGNLLMGTESGGQIIIDVA